MSNFWGGGAKVRVLVREARLCPLFPLVTPPAVFCISCLKSIYIFLQNEQQSFFVFIYSNVSMNDLQVGCTVYAGSLLNVGYDLIFVECSLCRGDSRRYQVQGTHTFDGCVIFGVKWLSNRFPPLLALSSLIPVYCGIFSPHLSVSKIGWLAAIPRSHRIPR